VWLHHVKWGYFCGDFEKIHDYDCDTKHGKDYWTFMPQDRMQYNVSCCFNYNVYDFIQTIMGFIHVFACVHVRNIIEDNDHIYIVTKFQDAIVIDVLNLQPMDLIYDYFIR
jgi:hypothetical protein